MVFSVKTSGVAAILSLAASVAAHGHVVSIDVAGKTVKGFDLGDAYQNPVPESIGWQTTALDNGFVEPAKFGTSDIACHLGGKPGKLFATVAAGSEVTIKWDTWPDSHRGPVLDYLAPFADSAADLKFFKFAESGFTGGKFASESINAASGFTWKTTIPSDIAPGKYVLRHEIIALHGSTSVNGAQNYPQCLNLEITGTGTAKPAGVAATSLYKETDAGILIPSYYSPGITSYDIPGPAIYSSGGSGSAPAPQPSATTPSETSAAPQPTSSSAPEETSAPQPTQTASPVETSAPSPTSSKSKSACKPKTKTPSSTAAPTPVAIETILPTVTAVPTPSATQPATEPVAETPSPSDSATELPAGTKLSSVLSWLSKFYAANGDKFDNESALRRRHARQF